MGGFGDLFGSLGDLIGGLTESAGEGEVAGAALEAFGIGRREARGPSEGYDATTAVDRYLCGGPRILNINDV